MSEFDSLNLIFLLMAAILPVSALMGRKLAWKKGVVMALAWASIFVIVAVFIGLVMP